MEDKIVYLGTGTSIETACGLNLGLSGAYSLKNCLKQVTFLDTINNSEINRRLNPENLFVVCGKNKNLHGMVINKSEKYNSLNAKPLENWLGKYLADTSGDKIVVTSKSLSLEVEEFIGKLGYEVVRFS